MSGTVAGALLGGALALVWIVLGFWAVLAVAVAMVVGAALGRLAEGRLDLRAVADAVRGRRASS